MNLTAKFKGSTALALIFYMGESIQKKIDAESRKSDFDRQCEYARSVESLIYNINFSRLNLFIRQNGSISRFIF